MVRGERSREIKRLGLSGIWPHRALNHPACGGGTATFSPEGNGTSARPFLFTHIITQERVDVKWAN